MAKTSTRVNRPAFYVYSTLTNGTDFFDWVPAGDTHAIPTRGKMLVSIAGGAGVAQKRTLITPLGVRTDITQEQKEYLDGNVEFQRMLKEGWMKLVKANSWQTDVEEVISDMQQRDGSSPVVPNDYEMQHLKTPSTGGAGRDRQSPTTLPRSQPFIHNPLGLR